MRFQLILNGALALILTLSTNLHAVTHEIIVYKTRACGCCGIWVNHIKANGFQVTVKEVASTLEYQRKYGAPEKLSSCHTAIVEGYTIEGHVPASEIRRLLKERPKAKGLAVPGMPLGSPGMESGGRSERYQVLLFQEDGRTSVYKECPAR